MIAIRAHFDGGVIVPDEPFTLRASSQVVVLVDADPSKSTAELAEATRRYYQQTQSDAEDDSWGAGVTPGSTAAWDQE